MLDLAITFGLACLLWYGLYTSAWWLAGNPGRIEESGGEPKSGPR